ncbi:MAG: ketopantoate reductase family protein [Thermoplasmata archaeon]
MKVLVVGAGAVGSVLGARLSSAGHEVELLSRPAHVAAIRVDGLRLEGAGGGVFRPSAITDFAQATRPDVVLLTVKTPDLGAVATKLGARFPTLVPTLLPQNGLTAESLVVGPLRAAGGADPGPWLVRAVNSIPATLVAPGVVRLAGDGEIVLRDPAVATPSSTSIAILRDLLARTGIRVRLVPDLERELWRKALINAAVNPVTALGGVVNGRLGDPPYRDEAHTLLREAQRAAALAGFPFSDADADADLERVIRATAENRSSMLQDVDRGRSTEVDAISGEIVRTARAHGVDLPATRAVVVRLEALARARAGRTQPS